MSVEQSRSVDDVQCPIRPGQLKNEAKYKGNMQSVVLKVGFVDILNTFLDTLLYKLELSY